jgi:hypothetical protein
MRQSQIQFIREQGCLAPNPPDSLYAALMLQPKIIAGVVALGVVLQSRWLFVTLSAVLWWSTFVPAYSPFDSIYNHAVAYPRGLPPLGAAPAPRRFAQSQAALLSLAIATAILGGAAGSAWVLEGLFVVALIALIYGRVCAGARMYHALRRSVYRTASLPAGAGHSC